MPFSHHSHSGQFCPGHARNTLEEAVQTAIEKRLQVFALTEHMPRHEMDFYVEELGTGATLESGFANQDAYHREAVQLRQKYASQIEILVGFEGEWIRPESVDLVQRTLRDHEYDFFIGSVHHVHTHPIDYEQEDYLKARMVSGGSDERLFEDYFDAQFAMLQALKPPIVGHFDLIRLKSDDPNGSFREMAGVWERIMRNLDFIASYGGLLELNFASLRKGMTEPYPKAEICQAFLARAGKFCLSDDSHGVEQIALNYDKLPSFLPKAGITALHFLTRADRPHRDPMDPRFCCLQVNEISCEALVTMIG